MFFSRSINQTSFHFRSLDNKAAFTRATVRPLVLEEPSRRYQVAGRQPLWPSSGSNNQRLNYYCTLKLRHWSDTFFMRAHANHSSAHCQNETQISCATRRRNTGQVSVTSELRYSCHVTLTVARR